MALIPGGEYVFGPVKEKVTVKPFCLDVNEVAAGEYAACVTAGKCDKGFVTVCDPSTYGKAGSEKLPMVCVDFKQAETYCAAQDKRLASGEEWEWAARGGDAARPRPWGEGELGDQLCWSGKGKRTGPCEVGSFPAGKSPQGVHDLLGGVLEWTTLRTDATSSNRVARGGSWKDGDKALISVDRPGAFKATYRCGFAGIRCAKAAP
jgi:formylglycine-generating enzyme required for sulfatase activity